MPSSEIASIKHRRPEFSRYLAEMGKPTRLGEALTIVGHPFADPVSNSDLLRMAIKFGLPESKIEEANSAINITGFTTRYSSHSPEEEPDSPFAIEERASDIGAILLRETMKAQDWDRVDVFIDTSAFLPPTINRKVLEKAGLDPSRVTSRSYRYACAGAVGALIDCLSDDNMRDARIIISALEPLSQFVNKNQFLSKEGLAFPSIFGDAYADLAIGPRHIKLETKRILIKPDGGLIRLNPLYDFDQQPSEPDLVPEYYDFVGNGKEFFRYSRSGAFLKLLPPKTGSIATMDGPRVGVFFGNNTTDAIIYLLDKNGNQDLLRQIGVDNAIVHPASRPVVNRISERLKDRGYLDKESPGFPFLMDQAGQSNGSSATTLNRLRFMIENGLFNPKKKFFIAAPGIGSVIACATGMIL